METKSFSGLDTNKNKVDYLVKNPEQKDFRSSQIAYSKAYRRALDGGAILKAKLLEYIKEQGIWSDAKEKTLQEKAEEVLKLEEKLKGGGMKLSEARQVALDLSKARAEFREQISVKQSHDANSAEAQAENEKFNYLVTCCVLKPDGKRFWDSVEKYDDDAMNPWVVEAASEVARIIYGLDPDYDKQLEENKFLIKYKFVNQELKFINKDGHLVDSNGRLVNNEGHWIAYRDNGEAYTVNEEGREIDSKGRVVVTFSPFLDDDGNPIVDDEPVVEPEKTTKKKKSATND